MSVHAIASLVAGRAATGPEDLRQSLDRLKSSKLRDAETALSTVRTERAAAAQAMRDAIAAMQKSRDKAAAETEVRRLEAKLHAIDARIVEARRVRDKEREPLVTALRRALKPHYCEAARLLRDADVALQTARDILATAEDFAGRNGTPLTPFAASVPGPVAHLAEQLDARS